MPSLSQAYQIVLRCIKAIAGKAETSLEPHHTLEESGMPTNNHIRLFKDKLKAELANEGLEFRKMVGIDNIESSSTLEDVAHIVSYALPKGERFY